MPAGEAPIRPAQGQWLSAPLPFACPSVTHSGMVIFAPLALAAATLAVPLERAEPNAAAPVRQAQATVTILTSAPLRFAEIERDQPKTLRESTARGSDGSVERLNLVEFE